MLGIVLIRQRHSHLGYTGSFPRLRKLWTKSFVRNYSDQRLGFSRASYHHTETFSRWLSGWVGRSMGGAGFPNKQMDIHALT